MISVLEAKTMQMMSGLHKTKTELENVLNFLSCSVFLQEVTENQAFPDFRKITQSFLLPGLS